MPWAWTPARTGMSLITFWLGAAAVSGLLCLASLVLALQHGSPGSEAGVFFFLVLAAGFLSISHIYRRSQGRADELDRQEQRRLDRLIRPKSR